MLEDLPKAWVAMGHEDVRAEGQESRARRLSRRARAMRRWNACFGDEAEVIRELKDTFRTEVREMSFAPQALAARAEFLACVCGSQAV